MTKKQKFILSMTIVILVFIFMVLLLFKTMNIESDYQFRLTKDSTEIELTVVNNAKNETNLQFAAEDSSNE